MVNIWFGGWEPIWRILVVGTLGYIALVMLVRFSGKRTLAQMNSFDFVITVAIGAAFGRAMTARSVALAEAITAFALLIVLQYVVSFTEMHAKGFASAITGTPRLVAYGGRMVPEALRRERITEDEVVAAVRKHGFGDLSRIAAVVMEPDGQLTVVAADDLGDGSVMAPVSGWRGGLSG